MKLRTVIVLAGLGALAARKATGARRRPVALLDPGPPLLPSEVAPAAAAGAPEPEVTPGAEAASGQAADGPVEVAAGHDPWADAEAELRSDVAEEATQPEPWAAPEAPVEAPAVPEDAPWEQAAAELEPEVEQTAGVAPEPEPEEWGPIEEVLVQPTRPFTPVPGLHLPAGEAPSLPDPDAWPTGAPDPWLKGPSGEGPTGDDEPGAEEELDYLAPLTAWDTPAPEAPPAEAADTAADPGDAPEAGAAADDSATEAAAGNHAGAPADEDSAAAEDADADAPEAAVDPVDPVDPGSAGPPADDVEALAEPADDVEGPTEPADAVEVPVEPAAVEPEPAPEPAPEPEPEPAPEPSIVDEAVMPAAEPGAPAGPDTPPAAEPPAAAVVREAPAGWTRVVEEPSPPESTSAAWRGETGRAEPPSVSWRGTDAPVSRVSPPGSPDAPAVEEVDGWPVPAALPSLPPADPPPLPRVEDVPAGWSVVLYPEDPGAPEPAEATAITRVEPSAEPPAIAPAEEPPAGDEPDADPFPVAPADEHAAAGAGDLRALLLGNQVPLVFMGATPLPMLCLDRLVGRLGAVALHDCFDGRHGSVYVSRAVPDVVADLPAAAANALLATPDVVDRLRLRPGRIVVLTGDEETERLAESFGHVVALAPAAMRRRLGAQSELVRLAREAGVHALPAVAGHAASYQDLLLLARGLGTDLLVESLDQPGRGPVPVGSLEDWSAHERRLGAEHLRVTRRVDGPAYALAGVVGPDGVAVAPVVADVRVLPGDPPYGGGTIVSDVAAALEQDLLARLRAAARAVGARLAQDGFRGMFEVDLAVDRRADTGPTLTAIRPEGSAATMLDTVSATAEGAVPVLALHLGVQLGGTLGALTADGDARAPWSLLAVEDGSETERAVTEAPASGVWCLDPSAHGGVRYVRSETDWRTLSGEGDEVFYLRVARAGSVCAPGGTLGVVVAPGRLATDEGQPSEAAQLWVKGIRRNVWTAAAPSTAESMLIPPGLLAV